MGGAVLLRADADASIGVGHVMRCLALAQALTDAGGRAIFASTALPDSISRRLEHEHLPVRMICAQPGSASEAEATARVAREEMAGRIVVDGYHLGPDYLAGLHRHGLRVAVIDDHAIACAPYAAVTLNQNIFAPPARPAEGYLSGLRYALLRRELRADVTTPRTGHSRRILITLGGADPDRMTELAIAACASIASSLTAADVVIGGANPRAEAIEHAVAAHASWARAHRDVLSLAPFLAQSDVAIVAAGGTMWEAMHWGVPMITIHRDRVQKRSTDVLMARGMAIADFDARTLAAPVLAECVREGLADRHRLLSISDAGQRAVDGLGAARVAAAVAAM